jgi:hypothetical protein
MFVWSRRGAHSGTHPHFIITNVLFAFSSPQASITEAALAGMHQGPGTPINYVDLPAILWEEVLPSIGVPVSVEEIAAMVKISTQYSKGGDGRSAEFHQDSEKKEKMASQAVKEASAMFLQESYDALQAFKVK